VTVLSFYVQGKAFPDQPAISAALYSALTSAKEVHYAFGSAKGRIQSAERAVPTFSKTNTHELLSA
jgi:hypothetical protein